MRVLSTRVAAVALGVTLALGAVTPAAADGGDRGGSTTTTTTVTTTTSPHAGGVDVRRRWRRYQRELTAIDRLFIASVARAETTFHRDLRRVKSSAEQVIARAVLRQALAQASADREVELERLGDPPERPAHAAHARGHDVRATAAVR